jgi:hypothetical protein
MIKATNCTTSLADAPALQASRRGLLMGFAAAIAVPAPAFATALSEIPAPAAVPPLTPAQPIGFAPDPIFDVIKRHTRAMRHTLRTLRTITES